MTSKHWLSGWKFKCVVLAMFSCRSHVISLHTSQLECELISIQGSSKVKRATYLSNDNWNEPTHWSVFKDLKMKKNTQIGAGSSISDWSLRLRFNLIDLSSAIKSASSVKSRVRNWWLVVRMRKLFFKCIHSVNYFVTLKWFNHISHFYSHLTRTRASMWDLSGASGLNYSGILRAWSTLFGPIRS